MTLPTPGSASAGDGLWSQDITIATAPQISAVTSTTPAGQYSVGTVIPIAVTFDEAVTVTGTPQLALNSALTAAAGYFSGTGTNTLTFDYTVAAGDTSLDLDYASTAALSLAGGTIQDSFGSNAILTLPAIGYPLGGDGLAGQGIIIDTAAPTVSTVTTSATAGQYKAGTVIPITVTFGEPVNVTGTPQLTLNDGAVVNYSSGSGGTALVFDYTVAAGENTSLLDYASTSALSGTIKDAAGNAYATAAGLPAVGSDGLWSRSIVVDTTAPTVSAVSSTTPAGQYPAGTVIPITVTFSETVNVIGTPQLTLNDGAVVNYASGSGSTALVFDYTVAAGDNTSDLDYASTSALAGTVKDVAGNALLTGGALPATGYPLGGDGLWSQGIIIDTTAPTISTVTSTTSSGWYGTAAVIPIYVTFSEPVNVTGTPTLALNTIPAAVASYASGTGTNVLLFNYTVAAGQNASRLDYASTAALTLSGGTIADAATNAANLALPPTGGAPSGSGLWSQDIIIDTVPPTVTGVTSTASGYHKLGDVIPITVSFNGRVNVTGTPQLTLNDGAVVNYSSGSGTSALVFNYTVAPGENVAGLDYASTGALTLNGGTIIDPAGNAAMLALPATGYPLGGDGLAAKGIVIETTPPSVASVTTSASAGYYKAGAVIPISVNFGNAVNVTGTPQLTLNNGAVVSYSSGSGTTALVFNYTVAVGQDCCDLDYASCSALAMAGGSIADFAGNVSGLALPAIGTDALAAKGVVIDTTAPTVTGVTTTAVAGYYKVGTVVPITVNFSEAVNVSGTPQLALGDGAVAGYSSGSGTTALVFDYTVGAGQNSPQLDYASTSALSLGGGSIVDAAGNAANLTLPAVGSDGLWSQDVAIDTTPPTVTLTALGTPTGNNLPAFAGAAGAAAGDFEHDYVDGLQRRRHQRHRG